MTSVRRPTRSASTWATCAVRPRPEASAASCTPCAAWATSCASHDAMMALRHRLTLLAAGTVGITVVLVSLVAFLVLRNELRGQVDDALADQYTQVASSADRFGFGPELRFPAPPARGGAPSGPVQLLDSDGDRLMPARSDLPVPVDDSDRAVA